MYEHGAACTTALSKGIAHYSAELAERYMLEKYGMSIGEKQH